MNRSLLKRRTLCRHISKNRPANFLKFCILNSLMPLIMCNKFQINQVILTLFSGMWDKNLTPVAEKVVKCPGNRVQDTIITRYYNRFNLFYKYTLYQIKGFQTYFMNSPIITRSRIQPIHKALKTLEFVLSEEIYFRTKKLRGTGQVQRRCAHL